MLANVVHRAKMNQMFASASHCTTVSKYSVPFLFPQEHPGYPWYLHWFHMVCRILREDYLSPTYWQWVWPCDLSWP